MLKMDAYPVATPAAGDYVLLQDVSDVTDDPAGSTRRATVASLAGAASPYRGARVRTSVNLATASGAGVTLGWDTQDRDTDNLWDPAAPTRLTIPAGVSLVKLRGQVRFADNSNGQRHVFMVKNGLVFPGRGSTKSSGLGGDLGCQSDAVDVVAGDYFELSVVQTSGGSLNVLAGEMTWFAIEVVA